jgi:hypothetical protein
MFLLSELFKDRFIKPFIKIKKEQDALILLKTTKLPSSFIRLSPQIISE